MESAVKNYYQRNWRAALSAIVFCLLAMAVSAAAYAKEPLLIIRTEGKGFEQAVQGLREELEEEFSLNEMIIDKRTSINDLAGKMGQVRPRGVVLMDNISIFLYKKYQRRLPDSAVIIPSVSLMGSFMDLAVRGMKNATGIFYEVPLVTSVVNLRLVLPSVPFHKVGIVHRAFMEPSVRINKTYCAKEDVRLASYQIPDKRNIKPELDKGLKKLVKKEKINALWVSNDNKIVNAELLRSVWIPFAKRFQKPIFVGVEVLVHPKFMFGTFAVIPDHVQIGVQAAEIIFDIMERGWQVGDRQVEPPRSVYKILNLRQAERFFKVDEENLDKIDKILR